MTQTQIGIHERYEQCQSHFANRTRSGNYDDLHWTEELDRLVREGYKLRVIVSGYHDGQMSQPDILAASLKGGGVYVELGWTNIDRPVACTVAANILAAEAWLQAQGVRSPEISRSLHPVETR